jgi:D-tyrosyl-tRNA(Tyr) deacylase
LVSDGTRAGFSTAKPPAPAAVLYDYFLSQIRQVHTPIASGIFGADMQVSLNFVIVIVKHSVSQ